MAFRVLLSFLLVFSAAEDFYRALLRIWLGERPVQEDLKKALLGEMSGSKP
jgi:hypothetical protein